jgi:excisionase family DNA binding protein
MPKTQEGPTPAKMIDPPDRYAEAQKQFHATTAPDEQAEKSPPEQTPVATPTDWGDLPLVMDALPVANLVGCSMNTLYELCRQGELPARRVGRQWRFSRDLIRRCIEGGVS